MTHDSEVAGRDEVFNNRWGIAAAAEWTPTDALTFGFDYYHLSTDYMPDWGHPYDVENNRPFAVDRDNFYGVLSRDFGETFADVYTADAKWVISDTVEFDTILRYGQSKNAYTASAPERPDAESRTVSANAKRRDAVTDYWTNQSRLTFRFDTGTIGHTLVTGIELSREETLNRTRAFTECAELPCTGSASNPLLNLDNPDNSIPWGSDTEVTGRPTIKTETAALYVLDTLTFSPKWEAFIGLRADSYSAETRGWTRTARAIPTSSTGMPASSTSRWRMPPSMRATPRPRTRHANSLMPSLWIMAAATRWSRRWTRSRTIPSSSARSTISAATWT